MGATAARGENMEAQNTREREYLSQAAVCERSAAETLDPIAAKTYRDMARRWRELAQQTSSAFTLVSP
jgi:hypothetical protein